MRNLYALCAVAAVAAVAVAGVAALLWPSGPPPNTSDARTAHHAVTLEVTERSSGVVILDLEVTDDDGRPVDVDAITVELVMRQMGHALPPVTAARTEPGHYRTKDTELPMPGQWSAILTLPGHERAIIPLLIN